MIVVVVKTDIKGGAFAYHVDKAETIEYDKELKLYTLLDSAEQIQMVVKADEVIQIRFK